MTTHTALFLLATAALWCVCASAAVVQQPLWTANMAVQSTDMSRMTKNQFALFVTDVNPEIELGSINVTSLSLATGDILWQHTIGVYSVSPATVASNDKWCLVLIGNGSVTVFDARTGSFVTTFTPLQDAEAVWHIEFSSKDDDIALIRTQYSGFMMFTAVAIVHVPEGVILVNKTFTSSPVIQSCNEMGLPGFHRFVCAFVESEISGLVTLVYEGPHQGAYISSELGIVATSQSPIGSHWGAVTVSGNVAMVDLTSNPANYSYVWVSVDAPYLGVTSALSAVRLVQSAVSLVVLGSNATNVFPLMVYDASSGAPLSQPINGWNESLVLQFGCQFPNSLSLFAHVVDGRAIIELDCEIGGHRLGSVDVAGIGNFTLHAPRPSLAPAVNNAESLEAMWLLGSSGLMLLLNAQGFNTMLASNLDVLQSYNLNLPQPLGFAFSDELQRFFIRYAFGISAFSSRVTLPQ